MITTRTKYPIFRAFSSWFEKNRRPVLCVPGLASALLAAPEGGNRLQGSWLIKDIVSMPEQEFVNTRKILLWHSV
ncbi:MAG: hypothetical protein A4E65_01508 [Syntrophorhabdus sp. PtaU1.Bin153]|nr:MAG: hypothetical protein A4E65_01508 [Syntrophorhabdus sp. PtaU1.Bin153]